MTTNTPKAGNGVTDEMVEAYLKAQREACEHADRSFCGALHTNVVKSACRAGLEAALAQSRHVAEGGAADALNSMIHYAVEWMKLANGNQFDQTHIDNARAIRDQLYATPAAGAGGSVGASREVLVAAAREAALDSQRLKGHMDWGQVVDAIQHANRLATPAPEQATPRSGVTDAVETIARKLYGEWTDNQGMHCNRFPGWSKLEPSAKKMWRERAAILSSNSGEVKL